MWRGGMKKRGTNIDDVRVNPNSLERYHLPMPQVGGIWRCVTLVGSLAIFSFLSPLVECPLHT